MAEPLLRRRWLGRITFVALALLVIFSHLIPLETVPASLGGATLEPILGAGGALSEGTGPMLDPVRWIMPDLLVLITLAWVIRRPSFAPVLAIALVFLLSDMLFQRPPGLWTALVLILSEMLRARSIPMRRQPFWVEWATVAFGITVITIVYRFTLSMVLVPQGTLGLTLVQLALTLLAYPAVVFVAYAVFGVSRPAPGEVDEFGRRL